MTQAVIFLETKPAFKLRDYQEEAIAQIHKFFDAGIKSTLLYAPTGAGKTAMSSQVIADYVGQGKRVLFIVHRTRLVTQTQATLQKYFDISPSIIWADRSKPDYSKPVQIAMLQSLTRRQLPPDIDLVILDECHTSSHYKTYHRIVNHYSGGIWAISPTQFLGLTATPWRTKKREGYCHLYEALVRAPHPQKLIDLGHLSRTRQFGYVGLIDESKLETDSSGEFTEASMEEVCDSGFNAEVVARYRERDPESKRKPIAFCNNVKQAKDLTLQFLQAGFKAALIVGDTSQDERDFIFENFASGRTRILVSVGVLCEGFDEATADCVLICRPIKSRALFIQMAGRGLRIAPNKEDCWIIDYCGNLKRLGLPTQQFPINLCPSPGNSDEDVISTKTCPNCGQEVYSFLMICPNCGYVFKQDKPEKTVRRGKLEEMLSHQQKKQLTYLKSLIVDNFNKEAPNQDLDYAFQKKWGYPAPDDWYDGVLFGEKHGWEVDVQIYYRYLLSFLPSGAPQNREWMNRCIEREFKSAIAWARENFLNAYTCSTLDPEQIAQIIDARIKELTSYKTWWRILEFDAEPKDLASVFAKYQDCVKRCELQLERVKDSAKILERRVGLYNLALDQASQRFNLSGNVVTRTFLGIKRAIAEQNFPEAQRIAESVTLICKEAVWNMLTGLERAQFNNYFRTDPSKPAATAKDHSTNHGKRFYSR